MTTATITLFDQGTGLFSNVNGVEAAANGNQGKLLLNILIELRVLSTYMAANGPSPQSVREDMVSI